MNPVVPVAEALTHDLEATQGQGPRPDHHDQDLDHTILTLITVLLDLEHDHIQGADPLEVTQEEVHEVVLGTIDTVAHILPTVDQVTHVHVHDQGATLGHAATHVLIPDHHIALDHQEASPVLTVKSVLAVVIDTSLLSSQN